MGQTKRTFAYIFLLLTILLMVMPFITSLNEILTRWILKFGWYRSIENLVVPLEIKSVVGILKAFGIEAIGSYSSISIVKDEAWMRIGITWNCVGWQGAVLLILTLFTGFQGRFTTLSKAQALLVGILGFFVVNLLRIVLVILVFKFLGFVPAVIFHDYAANLAIIFWLFFFWWFSYSFILEERRGIRGVLGSS